MKKYCLILSLCVAALASCTQKQGPSEQEIQERINAAVRTALDSANSSKPDDASFSSSSSSSSTSDDFTSSSSSSSSSSASASSYVGTYTVNDGVHTWEIILKSDETCTMGLKGSGSVAYGSWKIYYGDDYASLSFSDEYPVVFFPGGEERLYGPRIRLNDGYFYHNESAVKSKNPKKRLPITKVR